LNGVVLVFSDDLLSSGLWFLSLLINIEADSILHGEVREAATLDAVQSEGRLALG
jgi:hypothetical protein